MMVREQWNFVSNTALSIDVCQSISYVCVAMFRCNLMSGQSPVQKVYEMSIRVAVSKVNREPEETDVLVLEDMYRVDGTHVQ
jgi:hypothetical protein